MRKEKGITMYLKRDIYEKLLLWKNQNTGRVLELEGARQVGKTFILEKFAREQYDQFIYINMIGKSGQDFLGYFHEIYENRNAVRSQPLHQVIKAYDPEFKDDKSTVVVIDEIQESAAIYSRIREFACDFIVTGSYLGRTREKGFFLSAGDTDSLILNTLSFPEFLEAFGLREPYEQLSLTGESSHECYDEINRLFEIYCQIGGYPKVVETYLETKDISQCRAQVEKNVEIFIRESSRYFETALELDLFGKMFSAIAISLVKEKKGTDDFVTDFSKIVFKEESGKISKKMVNAAISWLYLSHVIGYCSKSIDCNHLDLVDNCRFYFLDLGVAAYFLRRTGETRDTIRGILCENFVYLDILKRIKTTDTIAGDAPWFAVYRATGGELDFYVRSLLDYKNYGLEVKAGRNTGKTVSRLLVDGKLDYVYYLKGDTYGGIAEGKLITVPIYLVNRIHFNLGDQQC